jgi:hypothetical protein
MRSNLSEAKKSDESKSRESYDRELQRHKKPSAFWKQKIFYSTMKNALAYEVVGLA